MKEILEHFDLAHEYMKAHFSIELNVVDNRRFVNETSSSFLTQYIYVVLNAGMKNQIAEKIFEKTMKEGISAIHHEGKRKAVEVALVKYRDWFAELDRIQNKIAYLETLPWIGPITKYHLARNLGMDCVKPDRHLMRLAKEYGFDNPQTMCEYISEKRDMRIGTVDVILWRYSNMHPSVHTPLI